MFLAARDWQDLLQVAVAIVVVLGSAIVGAMKKKAGDGPPKGPADRPRSPESTGEFPKPREPHPAARPRQAQRRSVEASPRDSQMPPPVIPQKVPRARRSATTVRTSRPDAPMASPRAIIQQMVQQKAKGLASPPAATDLSDLPAELRLIQKHGQAAVASLKPRTVRSKEILQLVRSPHQLRQAIILNELLSPPLSERPPEV